MLNRVSFAWAMAFLVAGPGLFAVAGDAEDEAFKKELAALKGTWRPVSVEVDGMKIPEERLKEAFITRDETGKVKGWRGDQLVMEGFVKKIDLTKKPRTIDSEITEGDNKGKTILGIYELDGDTFRVCVALPGTDERPKEFSAKAGSGCALMVYKREKK
jgi:uncharacterized protein (TIGR03067 family)